MIVVLNLGGTPFTLKYFLSVMALAPWAKARRLRLANGMWKRRDASIAAERAREEVM